MEGIGDYEEEWLRPFREKKKKRGQIKRPARRSRGTSPSADEILQRRKAQKMATEQSENAADLLGSRSESPDYGSEDDSEEMMKRQMFDKMLDDQYKLFASACPDPSDSSLRWGGKTFGLQKKFPEFVVPSDDNGIISRALRVKVSSGFTLETMVLSGLIPYWTTLEGRCDETTLRWMFHQLAYSNNRRLREATCQLFCGLIQGAQGGKLACKFEWLPTCEDIMTAFEKFGYTRPFEENAGYDHRTSINDAPGSGMSHQNAPASGSSSEVDASSGGLYNKVAGSSQKHDETAPEGRPDKSCLGGDGSAESSVGPMQKISSPKRDAVHGTSLKFEADSLPSNIRSLLQFLLAYFEARKSLGTFLISEIESLLVTLFRFGLDRRTLSLADLLDCCIQILVSCFKDAEWPSSCESIALVLSRIGSTFQNNLRVAGNIHAINPRFGDLQRRVVLLLLSRLVNAKTDLSSPAAVVSLFKSIDTKDKACDFSKMYNMLVLADIYLWSSDGFVQSFDTGLGVWLKLLKKCCAQVSVHDPRPHATKVRHWACFLSQKYQMETDLRQRQQVGDNDPPQEYELEDHSEIDDL